MALHLAKQGVGVIGTYKSKREEADASAKAIEAAGVKATMLELDVAESHGFKPFAEQAGKALRENFGRDDFDYLVNNAGYGTYAPFAETSEADFDAMMRVHVKAPFFLTQALLPMIAEGGRILNVSSGLAKFTYEGYAAYASAKGAVEVLTRYMAKELGQRQIRVNVIAPGAIATDFQGGAVRDNAEMNKAVAGMIALGRVGEADDIGAAVAALLSDGLGWMNGTRIDVSGGQGL